MKTLKETKILLTNDDGIDAPGLQRLRQELDPLCDLLVVAPYSERSASGCGLSVGREIPVEERTDGARLWGYAVDGTPADCVKFATQVLDHFTPDLVLSGINRGSNLGNSIWYSGTVAGAMEATLLGFRAMAVSLAFDFQNNDYRFESAAKVTAELLPWLIAQKWKPRTLWNLNLPNIPFNELRGVKFSHQGTSFWVDRFKLLRSENGRKIYQNIGEELRSSPEPANSDDLVVASGFASLSLLNMDMTIEMPWAAQEALEREWNQLVFGTPGVKEV